MSLMFIICGIVVPSGLFTQTMSMGCGVWRTRIASCLSLHPSSNAIRVQFSSGQFSCSVMSDSLQPHGLQHSRLPCLSPIPGACSTQAHSVGDAIQLSHPVSSLLLQPSIFPSIKVFSNELVLHIRWPKYWSFSFSISPSNEYSGMISFRMDWLDLLAVQGTGKSLLQHHSSKASILRHSISL